MEGLPSRSPMDHKEAFRFCQRALHMGGQEGPSGAMEDLGSKDVGWHPGPLVY